MALYFITYRTDGTWSAPQQVELPSGVGAFFGSDKGQVVDPLLNNTFAQFDLSETPQPDGPLDTYTLSGANWDWVWPQAGSGRLILQLRDFLSAVDVDLFQRTTSHPQSITNTPGVRLLFSTGAGGVLQPGVPTSTSVSIAGDATHDAGTFALTLGAYANLVIDEQRISMLKLDGYPGDRAATASPNLPSVFDPAIVAVAQHSASPSRAPRRT